MGDQLKLFCPKCNKESPVKETFFQFAGLGWPIYVCKVCGYKHDPFAQEVDRREGERRAKSQGVDFRE